MDTQPQSPDMDPSETTPTPPESTDSSASRSPAPPDSHPLDPPLDDDWEEAVAPDTKWPKVIGIISLIYALCGLLCQVGAGVGTFLGEFFMKMGGMDVKMPPPLKYSTPVIALVTFCVGLVLLFGAINLLRRRPSGVSLHKKWAIIRLVVLLFGVGVGIVMLPANIEFQRSVQEAQNELAIRGGRPDAVRQFDEDAKWLQGRIMLGVTSGLIAVYPLFIGFYLSRKKIDEEVAQWV